MADALRQLGFRLEVNWPEVRFEPHGAKDLIPATSADLFLSNSGTSMRFLTALCTLGKGRYRLDGVARMRERPIRDLLVALQSGGIGAYSEGGNGCPPVVVESSGQWTGPGVTIRGEISSQFVSALLMIGPFAAMSHPELTWMVRLDGPLVSRPYVEMTKVMMRHWGATWREDNGRFVFQSCESIANYSVDGPYCVEPDASAASYFWAAAALLSGHIRVSWISANSLQGDVRFVDALERMGCCVVRDKLGIAVHGGPLRGIDVDMNDISDTVMTLAAVACFAEGPTTIRNVAHIRHKETDRLAALATELRRLGAGVDEFADGLTITPRPLHGAEVETYNDHRMAMSLALIGLRVPGVVIKNPGCVAKTYPEFFRDLETLRQ
jgi:3-phosphoshikimate 1-carboxyvinyltransferase